MQDEKPKILQISPLTPLSMQWRGVHPEGIHPEGDKGGEVYEVMLNLSDHEI
jgi:hypothetical protein